LGYLLDVSVLIALAFDDHWANKKTQKRVSGLHISAGKVQLGTCAAVELIFVRAVVGMRAGAFVIPD